MDVKADESALDGPVNRAPTAPAVVSGTPGLAALAALMSDEDAWRHRGRQGRSSYLAASPWPHLVLEGLFPPEVIAAAEEQELPRARQLVAHRSHLQLKAESPEVTGPGAAALLDALSSPAFVGFLEEVTGVRHPEPDPTRVWGGIHANGPGSFQSVHRDFFRHPVTAKWHRINALVYLNSAWPEAYGGDLELWPADMSACGARIRPTAGTVVVFETTFETLHGVPDPNRCPPGRSRLSLASYYYNDDPQPGRGREPLLRRPRRPQDPWRTGIAEAGNIALGLVQPLYNRVPAVRRTVDHARRGAHRPH